MNTIANNTMLRGASKVRDVGAHRRAYLDTYARRRTGGSDEMPSESNNNQAIAVDGIIAPMQAAAAIVSTPAPVAVAAVSDLVAADERYDARNFAQQTHNIQQTYDVQPVHKRYLDSIQAAPARSVDQFVSPQVDSRNIESPEQQYSGKVVLRDNMTANLNALYKQPTLTEQLEISKASASAAHIRTIVATAMACGILSVGIFAFSTKYDPQPVVAQPIGAPVIEVEVPVNNIPTGTPVAVSEAPSVHANPSDPVKIIASSIGVNAKIDGLGTTPEGLIAVPKSYGTVGWYNKSSAPGKAGPTVLVGHYTGGYGGVFDKLQDLIDGDLVTITTGSGQTFTYRVIKKAEYSKDQVPMADIFKKSDSSRLEIITCAGKWQSSSYNNRLVVTAELVQ